MGARSFHTLLASSCLSFNNYFSARIQLLRLCNRINIISSDSFFEYYFISDQECIKYPYFLFEKWLISMMCSLKISSESNSFQSRQTALSYKFLIKWRFRFGDLPFFSERQGCKARKVISEVYTSLVLQCTVSGR